MMPLASAEAPPESAGDEDVRVMIVDDSAVIRGLLTRWLNEVPGLRVVASQRHGAAALNDLDRSTPDVVLLDVEMPEMDGITALPEMLRLRPDLIIIMASALTKRNAEISLRALSLGAKDYVPKPDGNHGVTTSVEFRRELIDKVRTLGAAAPRLRARGKSATLAHLPREALPDAQALRDVVLRPFSRISPSVLAIGASTGGPQALYRLFRTVGSELDRIPVLITQHMPPTFTAILADQIGAAAGRPAREACDGERLQAGHIYVAPGGSHMLVSDRFGDIEIAISDAPPVNYCRPAVDPMFESLARVFGASVLALVLTGMGRDGARGSLAIADAGGSVIAQDQQSSVVWGMPGTAARQGACAAVLSLDDIGERLPSILSGERS